MKEKHFTLSSGFTMIELTVILAIVGILGTGMFRLGARGLTRAKMDAEIEKLKGLAQITQVYWQSTVDFEFALKETWVEGEVAVKLNGQELLPESQIIYDQVSAPDALRQILPTTFTWQNGFAQPTFLFLSRYYVGAGTCLVPTESLVTYQSELFSCPGNTQAYVVTLPGMDRAMRWVIWQRQQNPLQRGG